MGENTVKRGWAKRGVSARLHARLDADADRGPRGHSSGKRKEGLKAAEV